MLIKFLKDSLRICYKMNPSKINTSFNWHRNLNQRYSYKEDELDNITIDKELCNLV